MQANVSKATRAKRRIFEIIQAAHGKDIASAIFDWFIIALILLNVIVAIADTFKGIPLKIRVGFSVIELVSVIIFSAEYALRVWTANYLYPAESPTKARIKFIFSFMAIVDLLAILPFYLPFLIPIDLRVLRTVRLLRLLRLLKINRYTTALSTVGNVIKRKAAQLLSSMLVVLILMIIASLLMYSIENEAQPDVFQNAFSGFWWAVATLTTVGYGDIYPITPLGKALGAVIALLGIGLVAVPTGIISAGFVENISREQEEEQEQKHYCPYCGKRLDE